MTRHPFTTRHRGTLVHEAAITIALAAVILASVVQVLAVSAQQSRLQHERLTATHEASNLMEQLMARSWEQLTPETVASIELSETCQAILPSAQLAIDVADDGDGAKQLNIEIAWRQTSDKPAAPVHLVAWKYPRQETDE
jgi:hypothetical protein